MVQLVVLPYRATATSLLPATTAWISVQVLGAVLWLVVVLCLVFSDGVAYRARYG